MTKKSKKGGRKKKKREKSMEERITGTFKSVLSILRTKILSQLLDLSSRNVITMRKTYKQSMNTHLPYWEIALMYILSKIHETYSAMSQRSLKQQLIKYF